MALAASPGLTYLLGLTVRLTAVVHEAGTVPLQRCINDLEVQYQMSDLTIMEVCKTIFSTTIHPINFTHGRYNVEEPRKYSVECEVIWINGSQKSSRTCNRVTSI